MPPLRLFCSLTPITEYVDTNGGGFCLFRETVLVRQPGDDDLVDQHLLAGKTPVAMKLINQSLEIDEQAFAFVEISPGDYALDQRSGRQ